MLLLTLLFLYYSQFATVINIKRVSIPRLFHMAFHGICDLKAIRKYNWKIKVRVTKKWCERNAVSGKRNGLNLILVDEEVSIHVNV